MDSSAATGLLESPEGFSCLDGDDSSSVTAASGFWRGWGAAVYRRFLRVLKMFDSSKATLLSGVLLRWDKLREGDSQTLAIPDRGIRRLAEMFWMNYTTGLLATLSLSILSLIDSVISSVRSLNSSTTYSFESISGFNFVFGDNKTSHVFVSSNFISCSALFSLFKLGFSELSS